MGYQFAVTREQKINRDPITAKDPFVNVFDDGSVDKRRFNTKQEAIDAIPEKWRASTKTINESKLR